MENKLEVRNLRISFRTVSGKVQAVRDISFNLNEGETLAIVGESGSGKSVTSKAILGILAGNSIVEGGEIIYDSMDLLKIPEDEFYKIRGDKIAMIFQDPLSSLNPIMKIGKQLTEAMILKGKARQKACRAAFNGYLSLLRKYMIEAIATGDSNKAAKLAQMCKDFDRFEFKHTELESEYNDAVNSATELISEIDNLLFLIEKNAVKDAKKELSDTTSIARGMLSTYVVSGKDADTLKSACARITSAVSSAARTGDYSVLVNDLKTLKEIAERAVKLEAPNFFSMGYYLTFGKEPLPELPIPELNKFLRKYLDDNFMLEFIDNAQIALKKSAETHNEAKRTAIEELKKMSELLKNTNDYSKIKGQIDKLIGVVEASIDPLEIRKDSVAYTFATSIRAAIEVCEKERSRT